MRFDHLPYQRKFRQPLATAHGEWRIRQGIIVRLKDEEGRVGFGEIASVPWFHTETFEEASKWCWKQGAVYSETTAVPPDLPCCGFAISCALAQLRHEALSRSFSVAGLVTSKSALVKKQAGGFKSFKTKIGLRSFEEERSRIADWVSVLGDGRQLRLDANGGLSENEFSAWLEFLEGLPIEFLEQPLGVDLENRMLEMAEPFSTPIALDESVSGVDSLDKWSRWPGPLVVKPSLLGHPPKSLPASAFGSSVFETAFGIESSLQYLARHQETNTAIGFDTSSLLEDDGWDLHGSGPAIQAGAVTIRELEDLWEDKL